MLQVRAKTDDEPVLPLKTRFIAWWEGYDLSALKHSRSADEPAQPPMPAPTPSPQHSPGGAVVAPANWKGGLDRHGLPLWSATRIEVAEIIWGNGFVTPGGADYFPYLLKPLGLNPAMTVLDLSAGLGGSTRAMAAQFGAWVTGMESSPELADAAMQRSIKAGMSKQASIQLYDPEAFSYHRRVDAVFSKEAFVFVRNKNNLFDGIKDIIKAGGQVLFTDYVIERAELNNPAIKAWRDSERVEPTPCTVQENVQRLELRGFDVRIAEDITELHKSHITVALQRLSSYLNDHHPDKETKKHVLNETDTWGRRALALMSGLKCFRFYALNPNKE
ncbi:Methyltransferase family protein [Azospirillaceae bacterium]